MRERPTTKKLVRKQRASIFFAFKHFKPKNSKQEKMILTLLFAALIVFLVHQLWWRRRNLPNGPCPLPIVGNALQIMWSQNRWEYKFLGEKD